MSQLAPTPVFRGVDAFGFPLYLGQLGTFAAGTNTQQVTYKDSLQIATNTNPVILNPRGECNLWLDPTKAYKFVLSDQFGNLIWTVDNITIGNANPSFSIIPTVDNLFTLGSPTFSFANLYLGANHAPVLDTVSGNIGYYARIPAEITAAITPTNFSYAPGNVRRYGAAGDGTTNDITALTQAIAVAITGGLGYIYLPQSTYLTDSLTVTIPNANANPANGTSIRIYGDGLDATIIKQRGSPSTPLLKFVSSNPVTTLAQSAILIERLALLGVGNTCHGVSFQAVPNWEIRSCNISSFNRGVDIQSGLFGLVSGRSSIFNNYVGMYFTSAGGAGVTAPSPANMVSVRSSRIDANSLYGCDLVNGSSILFDDVDFEGNGTPVTFTANPVITAVSATLTTPWPLPTGAYSTTFPDGEVRAITYTNGATTATWSGGLSATQSAAWATSDTGAIKLRTTLPTGFGASQVLFDDCWFEGNHGMCVSAENVTGLVLSFRDTLVLANDHGQDLNIVGAQSLLIDNCFMSTAGLSVSSIGSTVNFITLRNSQFNTLNDSANCPVYENVTANGAQLAWGRHTTWTASLTGCTTVPTQTVDTYQQGQEVIMEFFTALTGTSNTAAATVTGVPAALNPAFPRGAVMACYDAGLATPLYNTISGNVITLGVNHTFTATASVKGVPVGRFQYRLGT